jgi:ABC-type Fe3+ transport system substrate-binding protein
VTNLALSGQATATVRVIPDPTFDCTDVIGKVYDDANHNGYQDEGEGGLPDVRVMGDAFWPMTSASLNLGDDIIKKLFVDQEPVLSRDTRQMAEFMVRGRYPVGLGINPLLLGQFQRQGLGKNLKLVHFPELDTINFSSTLWLVNRAPHPNAAKVFINWLLTKDAQVLWAKDVETNSRRLGVEPGNPQLVVPRGAKFFQVDSEENLPEVVKTQDIAKAVIK